MGNQPINVRRETPSPMRTAFPICRECGTVHPVTAPGACTVKKGKVQEVNDKTSEVSKFINQVTPMLYDHEDKKNLLEMLNKTVRAWHLQYTRKKMSKPT